MGAIDARLMRRPILVWPTLILFGVALTLGTVVVGNLFGGYGFPLAWKTGGCPPPGIVFTAPCLFAIGSDWLRFLLDTLFYLIIAYVLLVVYAKIRRRAKATHQE